MSIKNKLTNIHNNRIKNNYRNIVLEIRSKQLELKDKSDEDLKILFKNAIENGKIENDGFYDKETVITTFAIGTIVIERKLGLALYDVQLMGSLALYYGNIAEMKTGEGKTVTSVLPILIQATRGQVHVCTVNEYLCERDQKLNEPVYSFFDYKSTFNKQTDKREVKQKNYHADIIYATASTFGFDYLNDNMVMRAEDRINQKPRHFALIDEADLILIDEARTPLIIGSPFENSTHEILLVDNWIKNLKENDDFTKDMKNKSVSLTEKGEEKLAKLSNKDLYSEENVFLLHLVYQSLIANFVYIKDVDYTIIKANHQKKVVIIDSYTGRIQADRRFTQGLHQALEAKHSKEGVKIAEETKTIATITLQRFFRLYSKLAGMTGTGHEERDELMSVYGLNVIEIETNKPMRREEKPVVIYLNKKAKWENVANKIEEYNKLGYPILVGTVSVEDSEEFANYLKEKKLNFKLLNAKQDKNEAEIIEKAGKKGSITIATNMAGRGTDIKTEDPEIPLVVFITEINESSRIDNQLKGRTSRQGARGIIETHLSGDDSIFLKTKTSGTFKLIAQSPLTNPKQIQRLCYSIQEELEGLMSSSRQSALKYDDVINEQRSRFYHSRDKVLDATSSKEFETFAESMGISKNKIIKSVENHSEEAKINILRQAFLLSMDVNWVKHIDSLDTLKSAIGWRAQSGHNPTIIYQNEASELYNDLLRDIKNSLNELLDRLIKGNEFEFKNAYKGGK